MMHRSIVCILLSLLISASSGQEQKNSPAGQSKPATGFTERVLKFLGIANSPGTLKGPGDEVTTGELWLADLQAQTTRPLISGAGYRSPIFLPGSDDVLALHGSDVVRISKANGKDTKLHSIDGILKLVGANSPAGAIFKDAGTVLILLRGQAGGRPRVALLAVATGTVKPVPYDPASAEDLQMLEDLEGWSRTYGDRRIYVQRQSKQALSGTVEWSDVFLQAGKQQPVNVSQCDGMNCGQPSLSADGRSLVFVKAEPE
jgi:hypothetical protein